LTRRPLWSITAAFVAVAWLAHTIAVRLVQVRAIPGYLRGASLCFWSLAAAVLLARYAYGDERDQNGRKPVRLAVVMLGYTLATSVFLVPYLHILRANLIGGDDAMQVLWNAWWVERALRSGASVFYTDMVWVPVGSPLVFHTLEPVQSALIIMLKSAVGSATAYNIMLLLAFPIAGTGAYAVARAIGLARSASFVGGLAFAWCPFLTSKLGWPNLAYCGFLALFVAALIGAMPADGRATGRTAQARVALAVVFLQFTGDATVVFAANITLAWLLGCMIVRQSWRQPIRRLWQACLPAAIILLPYLVLVARYALTSEIRPQRAAGTPTPEIFSYILPLATGSIYSPWLFAHLAPLNNELVWRDLGCYLGMLVLPLAATGWYLCRQRHEIRFMWAVFATFFLLSMGPSLLFDRRPLLVAGHSVPLPFLIWKHVPVLGMVSQSGRYLVLSYLAMAVGIAALLSHLRARLSTLNYGAATVLVALIIGTDYAFAPSFTAIPATPAISPNARRVMDVRSYRGETMYYQTVLGRPLVGGYLSRPVPEAQRLYRGDPCIAWLMFRATRSCEAESLHQSLAKFDVSDVFLDPNDDREGALRALGLIPQYRDENVAVWSVPAKWSPNRG
jgi:hypothetical protein